jgi:hypothetical protein
MTSSSPDWITLAVGYAWPLALVAAILLLRTALLRLFQSLADTVSRGGVKVAVGGFSLELPPAKMEPEKNITLVADIGFASEPEAFASSNRSQIVSLIQGDEVEAFTVDLKDGKTSGFLSSRLFLVARLMARQRRASAVAFVHTTGVRDREFLGSCMLSDLERSILGAYPEYEGAFISALRAAWWEHDGAAAAANQRGWKSLYNENNPIPALGAGGMLAPDDAARVVGTFLENVQCAAPVMSECLPADGSWVLLKSAAVYERGRWVTAGWLRDLMGAALSGESIVKEAKKEMARKALKCRGPYVALLDEHRRLEELIPRGRLLEQYAAPGEDAASWRRAPAGRRRTPP